MASISQFANHLNASARPNQFKVHIVFPGFVEDSVAINTSATFLTCQGSIPQSTIEDIQIMYRGKQYHEAGERTYSPWTCQIYNSSDFRVRRALEQWSHTILSAESTAGVDTPALYKRRIVIDHLDRNGHILRSYVLHGAYPQDVGEISLGFDQGNTIEQFSCTFVYDYFTVIDGANHGKADSEEVLTNYVGKIVSENNL